MVGTVAMNYHDSSALTPGTRIDQYAISDLLGRGGFGITYLVRDEALQRDFALKEFFPEGLVRREGTSVRFVSTPNSEDDYRWGLRKFYDEARLLAQSIPTSSPSAACSRPTTRPTCCSISSRDGHWSSGCRGSTAHPPRRSSISSPCRS